MGQVILRPDLKTQGGESNDILFNGRFVGSLTLVYREQDRISGAVQLEKESLRAQDKQQVTDFLRNHVQALIDALQAVECDILVTYSSYDQLIATGEQEQAEDFDFDWVEEGPRFEDLDPNEWDTLDMNRPADTSGEPGNNRPNSGLHQQTEKLQTPVVYELVMVGENRNRVEYHVYDEGQNWIAEAFMSVHGRNVEGEINWTSAPDEDEIEAVTELVVSDFDENRIDEFEFVHRFDGEIVEQIELTHEDLLERKSHSDTRKAPENDEYTCVLARDDGDMLTYEIYKQSVGGLPIGTATIDISRRQLSGFVDFREPGTADEADDIAASLMQELDKEKDYDTLSLTVLCKNEPIEELIIESEQIH